MPLWSAKISILVPVYNAARWLPACVDSVLAQRDPCFELIAVDDGSTDESGAILEGYAAAHPDCVRVFHQENRGLIMARRRGIALASGEVCMFLDADDMLAAGSLHKIRTILGETDADVVLFNYDNLYEPTGERETDIVVFPDGSLFEGEGKRAVYKEMLRSWQLNNLCMKAIRTPLVKEDDTPYEEYAHLQIGEDLLQSLYPVTRAERIAYCAEPLYIYRHMRSSMIGAAGSRGGEGGAIDARLRAYMPLWGMDTPEGWSIYARRRIDKLLTDFWQAYRAAGTGRERKSVVYSDWGGYIPPELAPYLKSAPLGWKKRVQLFALRRKCRPLLRLIEWLGGRKIRRQYGE